MPIAYKALHRADKTNLNDFVGVEAFVLLVISIQVPVIGHFHAIGDVTGEGSDGGLDIGHIIVDNVAIFIQVAVVDGDRVGCIGGVNHQ